MKETKQTIVRTFTPRAMTEAEISEGKGNLLEARERGSEVSKMFCRGQSESFLNPRTVGTVQLDLTKPYELRSFAPPTAIRKPEVADECEDIVKPRKGIANFELTLMGKTVTFLTETEKKVSIDVVLEMLEATGQGRMIDFSIPLEEYSSMAKYLRKAYPQCIVYDDDAFSELLAQKYGELDEQGANAVRYRYNFGGWIRNPAGRLHFLDSSQNNVDTDIALQDDIEEAKMFLPLFWRLAEDKGKLAILLLFALWAGFAKFFEVTGLDLKGLRAALYLSAPTGTGKTTLASIFTRALLRDPRKNGIRFEDTPASIEENLLLRRDVPILVDDFYAQGTKVADAENERKASTVMRVAGDGQLRGKLGADRKLRPDRLYRGSIICTGEYLALNTHSSILRCWQLFFSKGCINLGKDMEVLSGHPDVPRSFLSAWIRYLEAEQDTIIQRLSGVLNRYEELSRKVLAGCKYARLETNLAALLALSTFFNDFCIHHLGIAPVPELCEMIIAQAKEQFEKIEALSPVVVWKRAVADAIGSGKLNIAPTEADFIDQQVDGYFDTNGVIKCINGRVENAVDAYAYSNRIGLKRTTALKKDLADAGILWMSPKGEFMYKYSKVRKNAPHRPNMCSICLKEEV